MSNRILCVDDDPNILQAYQRTLRKQFRLDTVLGGEAALAAIAQNGPYAVVVADMRMPGMTGVELLSRLKVQAPDTVRMMLTGNSDQQTALEAVNEGEIFRFLNKPCAPETLAKAIQAAIRQYQLVTAERELLSKTLSGSVKLLTDILGLMNPAASGRASRLLRLVRELCKELHAPAGWSVELGAMLSQIGCAMIPEETLTKIYRGEPVADRDMLAFQEHPRIGGELLSNIPRLEPVAEIVAYQEKLFDGQGLPADYRRGELIPLGSRILKVALDWDSLLLSGLLPEIALAEMANRTGAYDPAALQALQRIEQIDRVYPIRCVRVDALVDGMVLAEDIRSLRQTLLCTKGQEVTAAVRFRLKNYLANVGLAGPVKVFVLKEPSTEQAPEESR
jgi:response regulator RpfG family c-di-GMP phosphodiesterase